MKTLATAVLAGALAAPCASNAQDAGHCEAIWTELTAARQRTLSECLASGQPCAKEIDAVADAKRQLASCAAAIPPPPPPPELSMLRPTPVPIVVPPVDPGPARYGSKGTVELSGMLSLSVTNSTYVFQNGEASFSDSSTVFGLQPLVGFFPIDGVEVQIGAQFTLASAANSVSSSTSSQWGLAVLGGASYFLPAGDTFRFGPTLLIGYGSETINDTAADGSQSSANFQAPFLELLMEAKVVVHGAGLLTIGLGVSMTNAGAFNAENLGYAITGNFNRTVLLASVGYGVYF